MHSDLFCLCTLFINSLRKKAVNNKMLRKVFNFIKWKNEKIKKCKKITSLKHFFIELNKWIRATTTTTTKFTLLLFTLSKCYL